MNFSTSDEKTAIALFDFDGTITTKDSLAEILKFIRGDFNYYLGILILSPIIALYKIKILSNHKAKEILLTYFLKGMNGDEFNAKCVEFSETKLPEILNNNALFEVRKHLSNNVPVVVISASAENWVKPWCEKQNIKCLSTKLEIKNGKLTGNIEGLNCSGDEKVRLINSQYNLQAFKNIYAYGDSSGDLPMLNLATEKFYKPFRK